MWRIPLGAEDRTLLLAPSWSGWGPAAQGVALALSLVVPLLLIVLLYRWELRLVSRRAGIALLMFRLLGLAVIGRWPRCNRPWRTSTSKRRRAGC
jgi:hypothetical protein